MIARAACLALVLTLTGCPKKSTTPTTEAETADCTVVADRSVVIHGDEVEAEKAAELREIVLTRCTEDAWPETARACMAEADEPEQAEDCAHQYLSDAAYRQLGEEIERAMDESADGQLGLPPE